MKSYGPPFAIPNGIKVEPGPWQECEIPPYSDGEVKHWPGKPTYRPGNDAAYRIKLAATLMQSRRKVERGELIWENRTVMGEVNS